MSSAAFRKRFAGRVLRRERPPPFLPAHPVGGVPKRLGAGGAVVALDAACAVAVVVRRLAHALANARCRTVAL